MLNQLWTINDPEEIKNLIKIYHWSDKIISDDQLDQLLGLESQKAERSLNSDQLIKRYGPEQFDYQGTPYAMIREFIHFINPKRSDIIYDLGSGFGRVVVYGAIVSIASFKGIEIVQERVENCLKAKERFTLTNLEVIQNNVLDHDFSDGQIFFLFNPFQMTTLIYVINRLKQLAEKKSITIASWGHVEDYFDTEGWLRKEKINFIYQEFPRLKIYKSKLKSE